MDNNPQALEVMAERFRKYPGVDFIGYEPDTSFEGTKMML